MACRSTAFQHLPSWTYHCWMRGCCICISHPGFFYVPSHTARRTGSNGVPQRGRWHSARPRAWSRAAANAHDVCLPVPASWTCLRDWGHGAPLIYTDERQLESRPTRASGSECGRSSLSNTPSVSRPPSLFLHAPKKSFSAPITRAILRCPRSHPEAGRRQDGRPRDLRSHQYLGC